MQIVIIVVFLSTLSLRRATYLVRGQRPNWGISIHALLAESDKLAARDESIMFVFLSTLSLRRATYWSGVSVVGRPISIHALLAESDGQRNSRCQYQLISIHALLAESDRKAVLSHCSYC